MQRIVNTKIIISAKELYAFVEKVLKNVNILNLRRSKMGRWDFMEGYYEEEENDNAYTDSDNKYAEEDE